MKKKRKDPGVGPLARLLGIRRKGMAKGRCCFTLRVRREHMNPHGVVHGGVVYSLVDYAMGGALTSRLLPDERCATLEVKINYLAPVSGGTLTAEGRVVERTKRIGVLEATVHADGGRLVALATGSFFIQRATTKRDAAGGAGHPPTAAIRGGSSPLRTRPCDEGSSGSRLPSQQV